MHWSWVLSRGQGSDEVRSERKGNGAHCPFYAYALVYVQRMVQTRLLQYMGPCIHLSSSVYTHSPIPVL